MHIALLNDGCEKGGADVVVGHLQREFKKLGHEVTLITTHRGDTLEQSNDVVRIPVNYNLKKRHRYCVSKAPIELDDILRDKKPDVVHAHNLHTYLTYNALSVAKKYTDRVFLTAHDTFLVSFGRVRGARYERDALEDYKCKYRNREFETFGHRLSIRDHLNAVGRKYWPLRNRKIRGILRSSGTNVITISNVLKEFLERNGIGVAGTVHNGTEVLPPVSTETVREFRNRFGLTGPTILFGGRMSEDKGSMELMKAFKLVQKECPDAQLLLTGEVERIAPALKNVSEEDRNAIVLSGWLPREEMRTAYSAATVATTPSVYLDPFNLMNIEAMAEGTPVVGTCFGGTPETIVNGITGTICNPHDTEVYAQALTEILNNPQKAEEMGAAARSHIQNGFTAQKQAEEYLRLFS